MRVNPPFRQKKPLRARAWFGKRKLAYQPRIDLGYLTNGVTEPALEGDEHPLNRDSNYRYAPNPRLVKDWECNLVTSLLPNGRHAVTLDLDFPAKLVKSQTKGHHHLYLDPLHDVSWTQYKKLLKVLAKCGIIEKGYWKASVVNGFTSLRKPQALDVTPF